MPEMDELFSHLNAYDISSVTHILKHFDPNDAGSLYRFDKSIQPIASRRFKGIEGKQDYGWKKDKEEVEDSDDMHQVVEELL